MRAAVLLAVFACLFAFIGLNWAEFSATGTLEQKITQAAEANQRALSEATHSLSAHLGEMDDKLDKAIAPSPRN
ncbi:hypothetical protein [Rhodoferax saidenbachensis]|uniref:Uncharacterized membrane protein YfbV (UPF0208 family) n=1 Tax=Rhodoferax saidenbachensis TaxID=1484693 RepID=A0ABU1ZSG2_9BURK|nr:hypothetical protein [Rhodoferax saidenbachensis]MDR7307795.1 uncharacterized membrane protein YfbV (UPF0208 family) [Rhodoferax saidenbachensis]